MNAIEAVAVLADLLDYTAAVCRGSGWYCFGPLESADAELGLRTLASVGQSGFESKGS